MKPHVKNYLEHHNLSGVEMILCEVCNQPAVDIHHIEPKGMGGSKLRDGVGNLIALCRICHEVAHKNGFKKEFLRECKK